MDITFAFASGENRVVKARIGDTLKEAADAHDLPLPGRMYKEYSHSR